MFPVVVAVERTYTHPKYHKQLKKRSKYMAHDEIDEFKVKHGLFHAMNM